MMMERKILNRITFNEKVYHYFQSGFCVRDATRANEKVLVSLGAAIESSFGDNCTHLIWSNGTSNRIKVAELLNIFVVSPLWIEQCKESGTRWPEKNFSCNLKDLDSASKPVSLRRSLPISNANHRSSVRGESSTSSRLSAPPPLSSKESTLTKQISTNHQKIRTTGTPAINQDQILGFSVEPTGEIPLPVFRFVNIKPLPEPEGMLRRSERISDLRDEDNDEDDDDDAEETASEEIHLRDVSSKSYYPSRGAINVTAMLNS